MDEKEAILSLVQSEKVKAGLIWTSSAAEAIQGMEPGKGAQQVLAVMVDLVVGETILGSQLGRDEAWTKAIRSIENARIMILSGVAQEAPYHLARALREVTGIGRRAMTYLKEKELL
jgi:hypothetical protein